MPGCFLNKIGNRCLLSRIFCRFQKYGIYTLLHFRPNNFFFKNGNPFFTHKMASKLKNFNGVCSRETQRFPYILIKGFNFWKKLSLKTATKWDWNHVSRFWLLLGFQIDDRVWKIHFQASDFVTYVGVQVRVWSSCISKRSEVPRIYFPGLKTGTGSQPQLLSK